MIRNPRRCVDFDFKYADQMHALRCSFSVFLCAEWGFSQDVVIEQIGFLI